jgi:hypothetical protein
MINQWRCCWSFLSLYVYVASNGTCEHSNKFFFFVVFVVSRSVNHGAVFGSFISRTEFLCLPSSFVFCVCIFAVFFRIAFPLRRETVPSRGRRANIPMVFRLPRTLLVALQMCNRLFLCIFFFWGGKRVFIVTLTGGRFSLVFYWVFLFIYSFALAGTIFCASSNKTNGTEIQASEKWKGTRSCRSFAAKRRLIRLDWRCACGK